MKRNLFRVRCAARMYARARGGETNGGKAEEGGAPVGSSPPNEGNSCSAPPTRGRGIMYPPIESVIKNSIWIPHMRKYRSAKIKRNELPSLSGITQKGKRGYMRRSVGYYPIGGRSSQINEVLILLNKYQRDMSFMKYLFVANCVIMASLILGSVHLLWGDSMNKYVLTKIEKLLVEMKDSSKTQTIIKGMVNDLLHSVINDEKNKNATTKFFLDTLDNSKTEMGNVFTDVLQTEHVRNSLKNVFLDVSSYLCNNEHVQMKVYHLLSEAIHLPIAINTSKRWLNDLLKSDSVTNNVREIIRNEIFNNDQVINNSVVFVQNALLNAVHDNKTKEVSKLFFASILSNPEIQQQISVNLWKILKMAISPKWMTYEGDDLDFKVANQSQNHVGAISCDVCHVGDVLQDSGVRHVSSVRLGSDDLVEAPSLEALPNREELLPLGRNKGSAPSGAAAPVEGRQMGELAREAKRVMSETGEATSEMEEATSEMEKATSETGEATSETKQVMNEMRHVIYLFERAHMCDGNADATSCERTYDGKPFQVGMAGILRHVDMEHLEELRSLLFPPHRSDNNSTPLSAISVCKFKSVKEEGADPMSSLRRAHGLSGFYFANRLSSLYFANRFGRSGSNGWGAIPPGTVLAGEPPLGTTSPSCATPSSAVPNHARADYSQAKHARTDYSQAKHARTDYSQTNYSPTDYAPTNHAVTRARGVAVRIKFFLLDAYRFYAQKYYFYYYYVERVKGVLQKALG
ncbi:hypothetical protein PCYB_052460, partial [Plasmodium cynomolgi strain B]